jgi:hypothetical protein
LVPPRDCSLGPEMSCCEHSNKEQSRIQVK